MRLGIRTTLWIGALLLAAYGCKGESASEPGAPEATAGGETPATGADAAAPAQESPWGATRAEQCRRSAPPAMDS